MTDHRGNFPPTPDSDGNVWLTLHPHTTAGIELGGGETIAPGETKRVPFAIAQAAVARDLGRYAAPPKAPA
jgi:hypothetical protein